MPAWSSESISRRSRHSLTNSSSSARRGIFTAADITEVQPIRNQLAFKLHVVLDLARLPRNL